MFHGLTKGQKHALRAAAQLAYERNTSMPEEDRRVFYLDVRNPELPIVVGGAVAQGIVQIEEIGLAARELVEDLAGRMRAVDEALAQRAVEEPDEQSPFDPNAKVSLSAVLAEVDFVTDTATMWVNRRTGEITVYDAEVELGDDPEESDDPDWVSLLTRFDINDYQMMKKFAMRATPAASRDLEDALHGRGAYRRFRDVLHRRGLEDEWYAYRKKRIAEVVRFELESAGIAFRE